MTPTDWCISTESTERRASVATLEYEADTLSAVVIPGGEGFSERWTPSPPLRSQTLHKLISRILEFQAARARIETETIGAFLPQT